MKIFSVYMAKKFFRPFLFGLGVFSLLIFLGSLFDRMNYLLKSKAGLLVILEYLWLQVPYWSIRVIPMATLLATLIAMMGFIQSGEWLGAQAAGFRISDFWKPVLWCSLGVSALSFAAQETILPLCYRRSIHLWRESIHPEWEWDKYYDVALIGRPGQFLQAQLFLPKQGRLERPLFEQVDAEGKATMQLDAKSALWDAATARWIFHDGVERHFGPGAPRETPFSRKESQLDIPPRNLVPRAKKPDEMSLFELGEYAQRARHLGASTREFRAAAQAKIAYPFVNVILCALGIPLALRLGNLGPSAPARTMSFAAAMGLSFLYLWCIEVGKALGVSGALPAFVAAWLANAVFGAAAAVALKRCSD